MGAGYLVDPTASEPWQDRVTGSITDTRSVAPPVAVSPPSERGALERVKEYLNQPVVTGDPFSGVRGNSGHPMSRVGGALADAVGAVGIPGNTVGSIFGQNNSRLSSGEGGADRGYGPAPISDSGWGQGSADSQVARMGVSRGGVVDNFGPGIGYNIPKPRSTSATAENSGGVPLDERLARMRDELAMYRAREDQGQQQKINAMQANANWANDWTAKRDAENAARSANFRATNGADMVLASGSREYEGQRLGILGAARDANAKLVTADANLQKSQAGLTGPPRNYIDEAAKEQAATAVGIGTRARAAEDLAKASLAGPTAEGLREETRVRKLTADQHQQTVDLINKMSTAKTPADARAAERALFAMHGKSPENWDAKILTGKVYYNELGQITGKDADTALFINKTTGEKELVGSSPGGSPKTPQQSDIDILKKNASAPGVKEGFDKEFGAGAAAKILGK